MRATRRVTIDDARAEDEALGSGSGDEGGSDEEGLEGNGYAANRRSLALSFRLTAFDTDLPRADLRNDENSPVVGMTSSSRRQESFCT